MADISRELAAIRNAVYGEEVRGSIIAALEKINEDSSGGGETVDIDADDLGLVQNEITEYVYPTYKGTASSHGIRISGGGESSSDYIFYYIFYYNYDGSELLHIDVVDKGEDGDYDGTPERPSSGKNAYTFVGWSTSKNATTAEIDCTKNVTEDKQVYAAYTVTVSSVELKYYNYDGSQLLNTETVAYGGDGTYSATPARASTAQYDYTFVGWSTSANATSATANATKNLTADKSVYAAYSRATKTYVLTYYNYNGGSSLYTEILPYGKNGTYSGTPTRASTAQYTYTFIGWSTTKNATTVDANATKNITSDRSVYAVYSQQTRTYSLKYYNYDGTTLLNTDTVAYGGDGTYAGTPTREADSQYTYTFVGWSTATNATSADANATKNITADKSVYAAYSRTAISTSHTLSYYNYNGSELLHSETVADGEDGVYDGTPARAADSQYSYTFVGWSTYTNSSIADSSATKNITADKSVYAAYSSEAIILDHIVANFNQSESTVRNPLHKIYTTNTLDDLKDYLTVTGVYTGDTEEPITNYTLSGQLEVGKSTITASYGGKSDTFDVYVFEPMTALPQNAIAIREPSSINLANARKTFPIPNIKKFGDVSELGVTTYDEFIESYYVIIDLSTTSNVPVCIYNVYSDYEHSDGNLCVILENGANVFDWYYFATSSNRLLLNAGGTTDSVTATIGIYAVPRS